MTLRPTAPAVDLLRIATEMPVAEPFRPDCDLWVVGYEGDEPVGFVAGQRLRDGRALLVHVRLRPAWAGPARAFALLDGFRARLVAEGVPGVECRIRRDAPHARTARAFARIAGLRKVVDDGTREVWRMDGLTPRWARRAARV